MDRGSLVGYCPRGRKGVGHDLATKQQTTMATIIPSQTYTTCSLWTASSSPRIQKPRNIKKHVLFSGSLRVLLLKSRSYNRKTFFFWCLLASVGNIVTSNLSLNLLRLSFPNCKEKITSMTQGYVEVHDVVVSLLIYLSTPSMIKMQFSSLFFPSISWVFQGIMYYWIDSPGTWINIRTRISHWIMSLQILPYQVMCEKKIQ